MWQLLYKYPLNNINNSNNNSNSNNNNNNNNSTQLSLFNTLINQYFTSNKISRVTYEKGASFL